MRWYEPVVMLKIAAVALAIVSGRVTAQAREKAQEEEEDLSANPLAGVKSKQPDKELYDKAMVAMKKGRFDVAGSTCRRCSTPIPTRNTGCAPSWRWATVGSRKAAPRR
jgi:hypothetical protein